MNFNTARLYVALALVLGFVSAFGQESPKPILIDEILIRGGNCEKLRSSLDNYLNELSNSPSDAGYVVVYQDPISRAAATRRREWVKDHTRMRRFDMSRVTLVLGSVRKDASVQFWRMPPGSIPPEILAGDAEFTSPKPEAKDPFAPYIYATEFADGIMPGCDGPAYDLEAYAAILSEVDGNRGNIVIGESTNAKFGKKEREILARLKGHDIERKLIKTFYRKVAADVMAEYTELWVLPAKPRSVHRDPNRYVVIGDRDLAPPPPTVTERAPSSLNGNPPPHPPPPPPTKVPGMISGGILNGKAITLMKPVYPTDAREVGASGSVQVEIVIDELGNVTSAKAVGGHGSLRAASEAAARASKFNVTRLSGQPVKVRGIIVYNFVK